MPLFLIGGDARRAGIPAELKLPPPGPVVKVTPVSSSTNVPAALRTRKVVAAETDAAVVPPVGSTTSALTESEQVY